MKKSKSLSKTRVSEQRLLKAFLQALRDRAVLNYKMITGLYQMEYYFLTVVSLHFQKQRIYKYFLLNHRHKSVFSGLDFGCRKQMFTFSVADKTAPRERFFTEHKLLLVESYLYWDAVSPLTWLQGPGVVYILLWAELLLDVLSLDATGSVGAGQRLDWEAVRDILPVTVRVHLYVTVVNLEGMLMVADQA